jgi:O-antigen ligase
LAALAVMALVLAGVVVGLAGGDRWRLTDPVFLISASIFTLLGLQSMMWAHSIPPAIEGYAKYLKAMAIVCFVVQTVRTPDQLRWLGRWIFMGAVLTVVLGAANIMLGIDAEVGAVDNPSNMRFKGTHGNANFAAASLTSAIPMGFYVVRSVKSNLARVLAVVGVLMLIVAVFATYSRQAIFALAFVAFAVWFKEVKNRKAYVAVLIVLLAGILVTPRYYWLRLWTITELLDSVQQDWSIYLRVLATERAWEMFKDNFFTGVGLRNFAVRSGDTLFLRMPAHNMYLEIACGLGVFGILAYLTMFYSGLRQFAAGMRERWREQDEWLRHLSYYLMVSLVSCMISGLFANIEFRHFPWIFVATGLVIANLRRERQADGVDFTQ